MLAGQAVQLTFLAAWLETTYNKADNTTGQNNDKFFFNRIESINNILSWKLKNA